MSDPDATEAANLKLIRLHYAAYSSGDIDGIVAGLDPAVEIIVHDEHGAREGERIRGLEGARAFFEKIHAAITHHSAEIEDIRADRDRVLANVKLGGTVRETGRTGVIPAIHLFTCHEGRITSIRTHRPDWREHAATPA